MRTRLKTAPATEPVTLAELRAHAHLDAWGDDADLTGKIVAARQAVELFLGRGLITQTWTGILSAWPECDGVREPILLDPQPVTAIAEIRLLDAAYDASVVTEGFRLSADGLYLYADDVDQPEAEHDGIEIDLTVGYGAASAVPAAIKLGLLHHAATLAAQREGVGEGVAPIQGVGLSLLRPFRRLRVT